MHSPAANTEVAPPSVAKLMMPAMMKNLTKRMMDFPLLWEGERGAAARAGRGRSAPPRFGRSSVSGAGARVGTGAGFRLRRECVGANGADMAVIGAAAAPEHGECRERP